MVDVASPRYNTQVSCGRCQWLTALSDNVMTVIGSNTPETSPQAMYAGSYIDCAGCVRVKVGEGRHDNRRALPPPA